MYIKRGTFLPHVVRPLGCHARLPRAHWAGKRATRKEPFRAWEESPQYCAYHLGYPLIMWIFVTVGPSPSPLPCQGRGCILGLGRTWKYILMKIARSYRSDNVGAYIMYRGIWNSTRTTDFDSNGSLVFELFTWWEHHLCRRRKKNKEHPQDPMGN